MENVTLDHGVRGVLTISGKESEELHFFELVVNGKKFFCEKEQRQSFQDFLENLPGDQVEVMFLHSMSIKINQIKKGRRKSIEVAKTEDGRDDSVTYNCTVKVSKHYAQAIFDDMEDRQSEATDLLGHMLYEHWLEEQKAAQSKADAPESNPDAISPT